MRTGWDGRVPGRRLSPPGSSSARGGSPRALGHSLAKISVSMGIEGGTRTLGAIFSRWQDVVGPSVATHARPLRLKNGVLTVAVDHPTWATQLRILAPELMASLARITGTESVSSIEVVVRRDRGRSGPARGSPKRAR